MRGWSVPVSWALASPATLALPEPYSLAIGPFGSSLLVSDYRTHGVPVIFVRHIRSGQFDDPPIYVDAAKAEELRPHWAYEGDLLVTKMGGPPGDTCIYPSGRGPAVITSDCLRFQVDEKLALPRFLLHALRSAGGRHAVAQITRGVAQRKVSLGRFAGIELPVAPLAEQQRIVTKLDELFSELDAGAAALERAQAKLERYRASVLKAAVEGRLTERWRQENPPAETGAELLERILAERRRRWEAEQLAAFEEKGKNPPKDWKEKYEEPVAPDTDGLPELPEGWCWVTVDQVANIVQYGTSAKTDIQTLGVPVLRMGNICEGDLALGNLKFLREDHHEFPNLLLDPGDLLFNRTNSPELVGKTAVYRGDPSPCSFASYLIRVKLLDGCQPDVVAIALNSSWGRAWVGSAASQQTGQANVNGSKLRGFAFPLPPSAEQDQVVRRVTSSLEGQRRLAHDITVGLTCATHLRQSILSHAFEGRLVPQDPDDEPASVLLERIRAERAATGPARGKPGQAPRPASD